MLLVLSIIAYAQEDVTRFLGIPVDGSKTAMIRKLEEKGFQYDPEADVLVGEFNGRDVDVHVVTNNNKVYRIVLFDAYPSDECNIKIRFNRLCGQFANNPKYISWQDFTIPEGENIAYEITVNKKRYDAVFYQKGNGMGYSKRPVWFMIADYSYGEYYIVMYYDNEYNHANGEDL